MCGKLEPNMMRLCGAVAISTLVLPAVAIADSSLGYSTQEIAGRCLEIYAKGLPTDVRIRHSRNDGQELIVYVEHLDWTAEIRCVLYRSGSLDAVATQNRKAHVLWTEPPMPTNP